MMNIEEIRQWIPRRHDSKCESKTVLASPNGKIWISLGGKIFLWHIEVNKLGITWEAKR
jgi:hypothetical protein